MLSVLDSEPVPTAQVHFGRNGASNLQGSPWLQACQWWCRCRRRRRRRRRRRHVFGACRAPAVLHVRSRARERASERACLCFLFFFFVGGWVGGWVASWLGGRGWAGGGVSVVGACVRLVVCCMSLRMPLCAGCSFCCCGGGSGSDSAEKAVL